MPFSTFPRDRPASCFVVSQQLVDYERTQIVGTNGRIEIQIPYNAPSDTLCRLFIDDGSSYDGSSCVTETVDVVDQYTLEAELFSEAIRTGGRNRFHWNTRLATCA